MLDSEQPSNLMCKAFILSPIASIWPFCGWAALLHISIIGGCIWLPSTPSLSVVKEGSFMEVIEVDLRPADGLWFDKPKEKKEKTPKSSPSKTLQKMMSVHDSEQTQGAKSLSVKPSLSLQMGNPHPPYPEVARENMIEGKVTVVLNVEAATGTVQDIQVISKDSPKCLVESVILTVKKWRFYPIDVPGMIQETFPFEFFLH